ncbi:MAG TPA: hypothetical protein VMU89_07425 [Thermomicrobiaceae bacterium]|nr:hypothetical protein [Thermomicrobiaceae bacterium]
MAPAPPFAAGRNWRKRASKARPRVDRRVWYDPDTDREYEPDPNPAKGTWHEIDYGKRQYREIDAETGSPVNGGEGEGAWRDLR